MPDIDPRLLDLVSAALCWAEWSDPATMPGSPLEHWRRVPPEVAARYHADAERLVRAMMGDRMGYVVVPVSPTTAMRDAAMNSASGVRSAAGLERLWREMMICRPRLDDPVMPAEVARG